MSEELWIKANEFERRTNQAIIASLKLGLSTLKLRELSRDDMLELLDLIGIACFIARLKPVSYTHLTLPTTPYV